jgi:Secretion system C-terminal sorting domain
MKKNLHLYIFVLLSLISLVSFGQLEGNSNKSRLTLGKKRDVSKVVIGKPSPALKFQNSLDRKINVRTSSAINAYYRSILLTSTNSTASTTAVKRNGETVVTGQPGNKIAEETQRSEDLLFKNERISVNNVFPNPANEYAEIDYQMTDNISDAKIKLFNVLGSLVSEYDLDKNERQLRIQTREIPSGVYYYRLDLEGKKVATKKLLVRH